MHEASRPRELRLGADQVVVHVTTADSDSALIAAEVEIPSGGGPPFLHRHDSFELYRVESGELTFHLARTGGDVTTRTERAGAVVAIPGGAEHTIRNESGSRRPSLRRLRSGHGDGVVHPGGGGARRGCRARRDCHSRGRVRHRNDPPAGTSACLTSSGRGADQGDSVGMRPTADPSRSTGGGEPFTSTAAASRIAIATALSPSRLRPTPRARCPRSSRGRTNVW